MNDWLSSFKTRMFGHWSGIMQFIAPHKAAIIWLIPFVFASASFFNDGFDLFKNHIIQKSAEEGLEKLNAGVSIKHVEAIFGAPIAESKIDLPQKLRQYFYSFEKFYLQVVFDEENTVQFFSVTSKKTSFHPKIPYVDVTLGKRTFTEIGHGKMLSSEMSSKFYK